MLLISTFFSGGWVFFPSVVRDVGEGQSLGAFLLASFDSSKYSLEDIFLSEDSYGHVDMTCYKVSM